MRAQDWKANYYEAIRERNEAEAKLEKVAGLAADLRYGMTRRQPSAILCGPPKGCTCPAVAWTCCCEASEHGRRMIAGLACDCGLCPTPPTCEITWCEHLAGHGPRNARCRCHGPLVDELGPGSPDCPDAVSR